MLHGSYDLYGLNNLGKFVPIYNLLRFELEWIINNCYSTPNNLFAKYCTGTKLDLNKDMNKYEEITANYSIQKI